MDALGGGEVALAGQILVELGYECLQDLRNVWEIGLALQVFHYMVAQHRYVKRSPHPSIAKCRSINHLHLLEHSPIATSPFTTQPRQLFDLQKYLNYRVSRSILISIQSWNEAVEKIEV